MNILKYPLSTEKAIGVMQSQNKLIFVVGLKAKKGEVKKAFEEQFKVKVDAVNMYIDTTGKKKAYIKLSKDFPAMDIATQLGLM